MTRPAMPPADGPSFGADSLPRLGGALPAVAERFSRLGTLGVVVLDASPLASVEPDFGHEAYRRAMAGLANLVQEIADHRMNGDELLCLGETGRHEILILSFHSGDDQGSFYRNQLPSLVQELGQVLEQRGARAVYPYCRRVPVEGIGFAAAVRNPQLGASTQLRAALEEAREDAALGARIAARRRRQELLGVVLAKEIYSVYEPIVDVATKTVFAYEALARGPAGTPLHSPAALFQGAGREGLLYELDCLCRQSGLAGAVDLPKGTRLFLNVRPTSIHDPSFRPEALIQTLARSNLSPSDVVFEISEQESIHNYDVFREVRDEYGKLGFQIALDDTGAGYASLEAVIELEPEFIKVDRSFVSGIDKDGTRRTLLKALNSVARDIGARIIGEGLDTLEELDTLGELGIPFGQGWLFGKPTPLRAE